MKSNYYAELPCNIPMSIINLITDMCVCINGDFSFPVTHVGCCRNFPFTFPLSLAITCTSHHASFAITVTKYLVPFLPTGARGLEHRDLENIHYLPRTGLCMLPKVAHSFLQPPSCYPGSPLLLTILGLLSLLLRMRKFYCWELQLPVQLDLVEKPGSWK